MKKKIKDIAGVTLIEILIGIVISVVMMGAMFTSYNVVNSTYQQVADKAKISQTGRDIIGMLLRDIRIAGYKYFGDTIKTSDKHQPILITKSSRFGLSCDKIEIVYGDADYDKTKSEGQRYTYTRYKIIYECKRSEIIDKKTGNAIDAFAIYKTRLKWSVADNDWARPDTDTFKDGSEDYTTYSQEKIIDHVQDLIFNPVDENGKIIKPPPSPTQNKDKIYKIKTVDIGLTVRSAQEFYGKSKIRQIFALNDSARNINKFNDKFLRDTIVVTAHARNLGLQ